jgi:hypothetical protein
MFLASVALAGVACESPAPKAVPSPALVGQQSPELIGQWELATGGKSTIFLNKDGSSRILSEAKTPGGTMKGDVAGSWTSDAKKLSMRRKGPDGLEFTVEYDWTLDPSGTKLKLTRQGMRAAQSYTKAAPK